MSKLMSPVQYESALEELNAVRPLQLQKCVRQGLDIPILNKLPKESIKSTAGTLARCTQQGVLFSKNVHKFTEYEHIQIILDHETDIAEIDFTEFVYKVIINIAAEIGISWAQWVHIPYNSNILALNITGAVQCNFMGHKMRIRYDILLPQVVTVDFYGFY